MANALRGCKSPPYHVFIAKQQGSVKKWTWHEVLHNLFLLSSRFNMVPTAYCAISISSSNVYFENRVSKDNRCLSDQCCNGDIYMSTVHTKLGANVLLKEVTQNMKFLSSVECKRKCFFCTKEHPARITQASRIK